MQNDDDLRDRVRALATADAASAPAYRRPDRGPERRRTRAPRRLAFAALSVAAAIVMLCVGLVLGTSTGYASARVEGARRRDAITETTQDVTRQLDMLERELARARQSLARPATARGATAHVSLVAAESEVASVRANVERLLRHIDVRNDSGAPPALAVLRTLPRTSPLTALTCAAILAQPATAQAQQGIPVVNLPAASARSSQTLGSVLNLHQAPDGKVVVNDAGRRQITLFDSTLTGATVVFDSVPGTSNSYGAFPTTLLPYLGDSLLFPDFSARTLLVLDPHGQVAHTLALPKVQDLGSIGRDFSTTDSRGRVIYRGMWFTQHGAGVEPIFADSAPLLRADFDLRRIDTVGMIARPVAKVAATTPDGKSVITQWGVDPVATVDNWSVLADGSLAIVRGRDYHVDWVRPNGVSATTAKLPFDWKRISDDDKRRIWDSTHTALLQGFADGSQRAFAMTSLPVNFDPRDAPAGGGGRGGRGDGAGAGDGKPCGIGCGVDMKALALRADVIPLDRIADFYPPMRINATMADADGNLWILPTTSTQSQHGELVYDVVNANGQLTRRVRVPLGRLVVGFGKGGVVYMTSGDKATGYYVERSRLPGAATAPPR